MKIRRTANAGVLLELDGVTVLLDGVCREVKPYPVTPPEERALLSRCYPDVVAFTHNHKDHYDPAYAAEYAQQTGGVVLGPAGLGALQSLTKGSVTVTPVPSRHIGGAGRTTSHVSYIIRGTKCVWFLGDASPSLWRNREDLPKPDVVIAPYAYANTPAGWRATKALGAETVIILHLPERQQDTLGLWDAVEAVTGQEKNVLIPRMGHTVTLK